MGIFEFSLQPVPDLFSPSPEEVVFPRLMRDISPAWVLWCDYSGGSVWVNGVQRKKNFLSPDIMKILKVSGDI